VVRWNETTVLASCLTNAQPLPPHRPAANDNSSIGCTSHDLRDDWSLASMHFVDSQYEFRCSFGCVLLSNQIYLTTMCCSTIPLQFIWSICAGN